MSPEVNLMDKMKVTESVYKLDKNWKWVFEIAVTGLNYVRDQTADKFLAYANENFSEDRRIWMCKAYKIDHSVNTTWYRLCTYMKENPSKNVKRFNEEFYAGLAEAVAHDPSKPCDYEMKYPRHYVFIEKIKNKPKQKYGHV